MKRAAALALTLLTGCGLGVSDFAGAAGATRTSPWYETDDCRKSRDELGRMVLELISRCGFKAPDTLPSDDHVMTDWSLQMSPRWRESFRSRLEVEIAPGKTNGTYYVRTRSWMEVNNNSVAPSDPDKAEWVGAGVTDRHKDRINEAGLRFHNMLKFRLFGLDQ